MNIVYEDNHIIVVNKEPGVPTSADKTGNIDLFSQVATHTGGFVGLVNRLDRPVGGLIVFAKKEVALKDLSAKIASGKFEKTYVAVVCGKTEETAVLTDYLVKNERLNVSKIVHKNEKGAKLATLKFRKLAELETEKYGLLTLVEVDLQTGRHHQIRAQLANNKTPIWGDTKYNEQFSKPTEFVNIALFAQKLSFFAARSTKRKLDLTAEFPDEQFPFSLFTNLL